MTEETTTHIRTPAVVLATLTGLSLHAVDHDSSVRAPVVLARIRWVLDELGPLISDEVRETGYQLLDRLEQEAKP